MVNDIDIAKLLSNLGTIGAVAVALLLILYRVTSRIVERMIAAIDRVAQKVDTLDEREATRHANVREDLVKLDVKVTSAIDWRERTPVESDDPPRSRRTNPNGYPTR